MICEEVNRSHFYRDIVMEGDPIVEAIEQLQQDVERIDGKDEEQDGAIEDLDERITAVEPIKDHVMVGEFFGGQYAWYHVDNMYGDDTKDGMSWNNALKTVDKAIELANKSGRHDLRIALLESPDEYELSASTVAAQCLHVRGMTRTTHQPTSEVYTIDQIATIKPVTFRLSNTSRPTALYTTHNNFDGLVIRKSTVTVAGFDSHFYSDGGCTLFTKCAIPTTYMQNGGTVWLNDCNIAQLVAVSATCRVKGDLIFTTANGSRHDTWPWKLVVNGGVFNNDGKITFRNCDDEGFLNLKNTFFTTVADGTGTGIDVGVSGYESSMSVDNALLVMSSAIRAKFVDHGMTISSGDTFLFAGSQMANAPTGRITDWSSAKQVAYQS